MKALTLWQPWASLVCEGLKPFEFRAWPPPLRLEGQRIAIHAGARPIKRDEINALVYRLGRGEPIGLHVAGSLRLLENWRELPLSSVLCTAVLGKALRDRELAAAIASDWVNDSDRAEHSNWGWPLTDIVRLQPFVPARGTQGLWDWAGHEDEADAHAV